MKEYMAAIMSGRRESQREAKSMTWRQSEHSAQRSDGNGSLK